MSRVLHFPLMLLTLTALIALSCSGERPTEPEETPIAEVADSADREEVADAEKAATPTFSYAVKADDLATDPLATLLIADLTITKDGTKIRRAFDDLSAGLRVGDAAAAREGYESARKAVADYGGRGALIPDDDISIDVLDLTLDAIETTLPDEEKKDRTGK